MLVNTGSNHVENFLVEYCKLQVKGKLKDASPIPAVCLRLESPKNLRFQILGAYRTSQYIIELW